MSTEELVRLSWIDTDDLARCGELVIPRARAELLEEVWRERHGFRYLLRIEPWRPPAAASPTTEAPVKWAALLALAETGLGLAKTFWWGITPAVALFLGFLAVHLPQVHWRAMLAIAFGLVAFLGGFLTSKANPGL